VLEPNSQAIVDLRRAAVLTGIAPEDLRRLSEQNRLGQPLLDPGGNSSYEQIVFTYDDLWRLCIIAAGLEPAP
jgi:hypothetical protein